MLERFWDRDKGGNTRPQREGESRGYQPNPSFPKGERGDAEAVEYNIANLLRDLYPEDVSTRLEDAGTHWKVNVVCPRELRGRIIGTQGRMINAIRTIAGAHSAQRRVQVQVDLEE